MSLRQAGLDKVGPHDASPDDQAQNGFCPVGAHFPGSGDVRILLPSHGRGFHVRLQLPDLSGDVVGRAAERHLVVVAQRGERLHLAPGDDERALAWLCLVFPGERER